jgi:hypothetical protein
VENERKCHAELGSASLPTGRQVTKSTNYETLKQVQGDKSGLFTGPSRMVIRKERGKKG